MGILHREEVPIEVSKKRIGSEVLRRDSESISVHWKGPSHDYLGGAFSTCLYDECIVIVISSVPSSSSISRLYSTGRINLDFISTQKFNCCGVLN